MIFGAAPGTVSIAQVVLLYEMDRGIPVWVCGDVVEWLDLFL